MIPLFPDTKLAPVPCCLAGHPDFPWYKSNADSCAWPWNNWLGMNNRGHLAQLAVRENGNFAPTAEPCHLNKRPFAGGGKLH